MDDNIMKMALYYVFLQTSRIFTISELAEHFNVSRKTMSNHVKALKESLPTGWHLTSQARNGIKLEKPLNQSSFIVKSKLWEHTALFDLTLMLLTADSLNKNTLPEQLFISKPKTQELLHSFEKLLLFFDLSLTTSTKVKIIGDESTIRYFFYWMLTFFFGGGKVNQSIQKKIPYYTELNKHLETHDIRIMPEKWRLGIAILVCLNRNAIKNPIESEFLISETALTNDFLSSFIATYYNAALSTHDKAFISLIKQNIFGQITFSEMMTVFHADVLANIIDVFMVKLRMLPDRFIISSTDIEYFFVKNLWRWLVQSAFHLPALVFCDYQSEVTHAYFKRLEKVMEELFEHVTYPESFSKENIENFIYSLSLLLNETKLLHVSIILSLSPGLANQLGRLLSTRYGNQVSVRVLTSLTEIHSSDTDILISDINSTDFKDIPTLIVELFEHDGLIPLLDSFIHLHLD